MTEPAPRRSALRVIDVIATAVLSIAGLAVGIALGGFFLVFTPTGDDVEGAWVSTCIGMFAVPLLAAVIGIVRVAVRRVGFWVPLVGLAVVGGLVVVLQMLSGQIESLG